MEQLRQTFEHLDAESTFHREVLLATLGDRAEMVIGPSWHGYVDGAGYRPVSTDNCRPIREADASALVGLHDACGQGDWEEASFDKSASLFGCFDDREEIVAASNLTGWRSGADRIGVVTRPDRRGRGYGSAAAAAATASRA